MLFFSKKLNHIGDLFENNGRVKRWEDLKPGYDNDNKATFHCKFYGKFELFFKKEIFIACSENISNRIIHEQKASNLLFRKIK